MAGKEHRCRQLEEAYTSLRIQRYVPDLVVRILEGILDEGLREGVEPEGWKLHLQSTTGSPYQMSVIIAITHCPFCDKRLGQRKKKAGS